MILLFSFLPVFAVLISTIFILSIASLIGIIKAGTKDLFSKALACSVGFILFHSAYILFLELFYHTEKWIDRLAPFALVYGPIFYLCFCAARDGLLPAKKVLLHLLPFFFFGILYVCLVSGIIPPTIENKTTLFKYTFLSTPISFGSYTVWSIIVGRITLLNKIKGSALLFIVGQVTMLFAFMLAVTAAITKIMNGNEEAAFFIRAATYCCIIISLIMILYYAIKKNKKNKIVKDSDLYLKKSHQSLPRYERSAVTQELLSTYEEKLLHHMLNNAPFLNKNLSLSDLSKQLKIPNHHLTQLFSLRIKKTFYEYVNELRVKHACVLLADPGAQHLSIEEIGEACGFNSRAAFNRNFKEVTTFTPSQFRQI